MASVGSFGRSTRRALVVLLAAGLALVALGALTAAPALAATNLTVSTTADTSTGTAACSGSSTSVPSPLCLREAVCLANNIGGEVNITLPAGNYKLSNGELKMGTHSGQTVNLAGAGAATTIIDGQHLNRVINIDSGLTSGIKSTITGVAIVNGKDETFGGAGIIDGYENGSAIDVLTLKNVVIENCVANEGHPTVTNKPGGAVAMDSGKLTIENSRIVGNKSFASSGGGVSFFNNGEGAAGQGVLVKNTVFESNSETANQAANFVGGALYFDEGTGDVRSHRRPLRQQHLGLRQRRRGSGRGDLLRSHRQSHRHSQHLHRQHGQWQRSPDWLSGRYRAQRSRRPDPRKPPRA